MMRQISTGSPALAAGSQAGVANADTKKSIRTSAASGTTTGDFSQAQIFVGAKGLGAGFVPSLIALVGLWQHERCCPGEDAPFSSFSTDWARSQHVAPLTQQNPVGKTSRMLDKSARDRLNGLILEMLNRPARKRKPSIGWARARTTKDNLISESAAHLGGPCSWGSALRACGLPALPAE